MIRHIVFFKLTEIKGEKDKKEQLTFLQQLFRALPEKISEIKGYHVGINLSQSNNAWDLVIDSDFESLADLEIYRKHPAHQAAIQASAAFPKTSAVVDYER